MTENQRNLAYLDQKIQEYKEVLGVLQDLYQNHPAHEELLDEEWKKKAPQLILPSLFKKAWSSLVSLEMSKVQMPPDNGYNAYVTLELTIKLSNERVFNFYGSKYGRSILRMRSDLAPTTISVDRRFKSLEELWTTAHVENKGLEICFAVASVIYYAYFRLDNGKIPWDLKGILSE